MPTSKIAAPAARSSFEKALLVVSLQSRNTTPMTATRGDVALSWDWTQRHVPGAEEPITSCLTTPFDSAVRTATMRRNTTNKADLRANAGSPRKGGGERARQLGRGSEPRLFVGKQSIAPVSSTG